MSLRISIQWFARFPSGGSFRFARHSLPPEKEYASTMVIPENAGGAPNSQRLPFPGSLYTMLNDLRYAFRTLNGNRLFAAMALLSLALGIGANTAIYSFMDAILVRTLPIHDPQSLVVMQWHAKERTPVAQSINGSMWKDDQLGSVSPNLPWAAFEMLDKDNPVLSHVDSFRGYGATGGDRRTGHAARRTAGHGRLLRRARNAAGRGPVDRY